MKQVRCKLTVENVSKTIENSVQISEIVTFHAIYSDNKEDNTFSKYTPNATADMTITNPDVFGFFKQGEKYFFDITKAD